jgi:hypothetical protein
MFTFFRGVDLDLAVRMYEFFVYFHEMVYFTNC